MSKQFYSTHHYGVPWKCQSTPWINSETRRRRVTWPSPFKLPWLTNLLHFDKQTREICFSFVRGETTSLMTHRRPLWCHFLWHVTATIQIAARIRILKRSRCGHQPSHSKLGDIWQRRCHVSHVWLPYFLCIFFLFPDGSSYRFWFC